MNKLVYLGISIVDKISMHEFWYHDINSKYGENA